MINLDYLFSEDGEENTSGYISKCAQIRPVVKYPVTIPKIIYQSWKTHDVPEHWKISPESIKEIMPDWKYVLMDNQENRDMVEEHFPDFLPYYDAFPYDIQRADAARYCYLYLHGGLYMDLDFEVQNDLSILFQSNAEVYLVKSGNVGSYYTNSFMASKPRAKFWLEVIEEMKKPLSFWYTWGKHVRVMCETGPIMLSRVAQKTETVIGMIPAKLVMPCSICNLDCSTCDAYLKPLEGSSWIGFDTMFFNFWLCHWKKVVGFVICILILLLFVWILYKFEITQESIWPPTKALNIFKN